MKKKQFKSGLNLNKSVISKLGVNHIKGGVTTNSTTPACPGTESVIICGPPETIDDHTCVGSYCESCDPPYSCDGACGFL